MSLPQIIDQVHTLLNFAVEHVIPGHLEQMEKESQLRTRILEMETETGPLTCYYAKSLYYEESYVAERLKIQVGCLNNDRKRIDSWVSRYCRKIGLELSSEQREAVSAIVNQRFSILTGGPGCGKTTTTKVIVALLLAMDNSVLLAAPTGRAAQRMSEVIGMEAKTIHRLLEFQGAGFQRVRGKSAAG